MDCLVTYLIVMNNDEISIAAAERLTHRKFLQGTAAFIFKVRGESRSCILGQLSETELRNTSPYHILINIRGKLHSVANLIIELKQLSIRLVFEEG